MSGRIRVAVAAIVRPFGGGDRGDEVLLTLRPQGAHLEGLWEFPGGKIEGDERPADAACREIWEELGLKLIDPCLIFDAVYCYHDRTVHLFLIRAGVPARAEPAWHDGVETHRWLQVDALTDVPMPEANRALVSALQSHLASADA